MFKENLKEADELWVKYFSRIIEVANEVVRAVKEGSGITLEWGLNNEGKEIVFLYMVREKSYNKEKHIVELGQFLEDAFFKDIDYISINMGGEYDIVYVTEEEAEKIKKLLEEA